MTATAFLLASAVITDAHADDELPKRPAILFNRWQEDWSALANPKIAHEPFDSMKYIPLSANDAQTYLSLGANLRERFETNDAANFGASGAKSQSYVISRLETHADLHIANQFQAFVQLESAFAPGKAIITPVDRDRLDLEQAFVALVEPLGDGTIKLRLGRQQIGFDLQRFVSVRDGPNVRQSYAAIWLNYEIGSWRFITFLSRPVQTRDVHVFDDYSNSHLTYGGFRVERKLGEFGNLTAYISQFKQDNARFPSVTGNEHRNILDLRYAGVARQFDWDIETMGQEGHIAGEKIRAWAFGSRVGYTIASAMWRPRVGLQIDAASGDRNPHDGTLGTFNPLFPNGYYVSLSGYTGYTNFIHLKPSLTIKPAPTLTAMFAVAAQWRETTSDAVYTQPDIPVAGTAGHAGQYTGTYFQMRLDWQATPHISSAMEIVHFDVADAIRRAGGKNSNYAGVEVKFGW